MAASIFSSQRRLFPHQGLFRATPPIQQPSRVVSEDRCGYTFDSAEPPQIRVFGSYPDARACIHIYAHIYLCIYIYMYFFMLLYLFQSYMCICICTYMLVHIQIIDDLHVLLYVCTCILIGPSTWVGDWFIFQLPTEVAPLCSPSSGSLWTCLGVLGWHRTREGSFRILGLSTS